LTSALFFNYKCHLSQSATLHEVELVPTQPADACTRLMNSVYVYGSIALTERGWV